MKFFALIGTAAAIRYIPGTELSSQEEENLVKPALLANNAIP